jgi:O-antigen/teichoic acid export membrane protein
MIALPLFSRLQRDRENLRGAVETCLRVTLIPGIPALLVLAASSDFLLGVIGPEWAAGADALKLLAVAAIGKAVISFTGPLLFAVGRPAFRAVMLWLLGAASAGTVVVVASMLDSASEERQIFGVALSRALLFLLVFVPINLVIIDRLTGFGLRPFAAVAAAPTAAGVSAIAVVVVLREATAIESIPAIAGLAVALVLAAGTAAGLLLLLDARFREYARRLRRGVASAHRPSAPSAPGR